MFILGVAIFGILKTYRLIVLKFSTAFYKVLFSLGLMVFLLVTSGFDKMIPIEDTRITSCLVFLLSIVSVLGIEMSCRDLYTKNGSLLKNPNLSGQLNFVQELGVLFAAIGTLFFNQFLSIIPFLICFYLIKQLTVTTQRLTLSTKDKTKKEPFNLSHYPFFPYLVGMFAIMLTLKHLQDFAVILGMMKLSNSYGHTVNDIYSFKCCSLVF